jgi:Phage-related minor tail protein
VESSAQSEKETEGMSSFIGQLRISLGLDSAAFESGAKRAAAEVNALGTRAEAAGFKVGSMTKALVAGASAFAGMAIVQQLKDAVVASLDYASGLSEAAAQMGVTAEALQEFRALAEQSGIATETMDKALQKLTRNMGEAEAGGKKQAETFKELGISLRDANGNMKSATDVMPEIARALEGIKSPAERARIEVALFGKAGQDLEPLLNQGGQAIQDFTQKARDAGIIISNELANKADSAADKIGFLQKKLGMKFTVAVAEHADDIEKIVDALDRMVDRFFKLINAMQAFANSPAGKFLAEINRGARFLNPVGAAMEGVGQALGQGGAAPGAKANASAPMNSGGALLRLPGGGTFKPGQGPLARLSGDGFGLGSRIGDLGAQAPGLRAPMFEGLLYQSEEIQKALIELPKAANDAAEETDVATVRIGRSFADMAQDSVSALQNMSSSIRSGDFLSILGSAVGLFTQLASVGLFGKGMAARVNMVPAYAGGTGFHPGGLAMVGERGPELVNLPRGSQVYPNGTGPGGGGNTYYFSGNLLTPEFWNQINAGHAVAAQAGGEIGLRKVQRAGSRRLA